ncbi:MAG: hypothetical protein JSS00_07245 [Proteobacteria bacterium]|nr:hypothetical protein [Pseudomonadota bacterium]
MLGNTKRCGVTILFTSGQMMTALGLTKQQWRTYRAALPELNKEAGRAACFGAGDLLAASVAQAVCETLGCPLSKLTPLSAAIFKLCDETSWPYLERSHAVLDMPSAKVALLTESATTPSISICVALDPLIVRLRKALLNVEPDQQPSLAFPPVMVAGGRQ